MESVREVYVSAELIGIIAAAIALGTVLLASIGVVRQEVRDVRSEIRGARNEIGDARSELRADMQAGFKELTARVVSIGDRLSKVEGIIEGMFWSTRNQPPDKPREA